MLSVRMLSADENGMIKNLSAQTLSRLSPNSLNRYFRNDYSQFGEDGILEEVFRRLKIENGFFVEFGAADGIWLSNTRKLWKNGWKGVFIESNWASFIRLEQNYACDPNILCLNEFITSSPDDSRGKMFDEIVSCYCPGQEIDFLSIDIDGLDYLVLESLEVRPKIILIECGALWHPLQARVSEEVSLYQCLGQSLSTMIRIGKDKGYQPICYTTNLFLVRDDLADIFREQSRDPLTLYRDGFRAFQNKDWLLEQRTANPYILLYEGLLQLTNPIDREF